MNMLDDLTDEQREIIVSLPYRVGLWISLSDMTGGQESTTQELTVLSAIINGFAEEVFGSELVQYIMADTLSKKDEWPNWSGDSESVLYDCEIALSILADHVDDKKELGAFAVRLTEIAEAVAGAFREYEHMSVAQRIILYMSYFVAKIKSALKKTHYISLKEFLSISRQERRALDALSNALSLEK